MPDCSVCGKPLSPPTVKCNKCHSEVHRGCSKKTLGQVYCRNCFKQGKKLSRYEKMAQRDTWA